jgi:hypothetical protein
MAILLLMLASATFRLLPHPANFAPITALVIFVSARWGMRRGVLALMGVMAFSDVMLGTYDLKLMAVVYGSFAAAALIGNWVGKNISTRRVILGSLASSTFFYLTTNFAVWAFSPWYARTAAGLAESYVLAVPFFRNALFGDLIFSCALFGAYALYRRFSAAPPLSRLHPVPVSIDI